MSDKIQNEQETLELMKAIVKVLAEVTEKVDALSLAFEDYRVGTSQTSDRPVYKGSDIEQFRDRKSRQPIIRDVDKQNSAGRLLGLVEQLGGKLRQS